jgi:glyoxylase-like metal-dependent hydrolase (beta-lactamase superfamily II)
LSRLPLSQRLWPSRRHPYPHSNQRWVVIDAGTNRQQAAAMRDVWGVDTVALAIVSHRHFDRLGGMDEILQEFPVERLIMNPGDCPGNVSDESVRSKAQQGV